MKSEPLLIGDVTFLVNRTIQQAPTDTVVREFFKNAEESAAQAAIGNRKIEIYPVEIDGIRKLAFWNTGKGMDDKELRIATDLSSSVSKSLKLDGNFGIGAKVSGLAVSKEGIRYRSCKDGKAHQVIIAFDEDLQTYARVALELPDGRYDTIIDVTSVVKKEGHSLDFDWTEVVLFGESADHDTVSEPLGKGAEVPRSYIPTAIFRRFSELAKGVEVQIDVAMTKGGGRDETGKYRQLRLLRDVVGQLGKSEVVHHSSGVSVHYLHDPKAENSGHTLSSRANPATASTTFCALVHKGERYDFKTKKGWSGAAPNFGIPFGSRVLTIEIMIPAEIAMPTQYRDHLTWTENRSQMVAEEFASIVRELMPDWVKDIVRRESPQDGENLDDLQKDLQKLLDEFRVPTNAQKFTRNARAEKSTASETGSDLSKKSNEAAGGEVEGYAAFEHAGNSRQFGVRRAQPKKIRKAPDGSQVSQSTIALERVPNITILVDPDQISEKNLKGRAGCYYRDAQVLFINGLYPAADRMADELFKVTSASVNADPEELRRAAIHAARKSMAFRVGKVVCFALSKRLVDDWSLENLDSATSPESLSMAADDYRQNIGIGKKWVKERLKIAQMDSASIDTDTPD
jgi:hypothetical protein